MKKGLPVGLVLGAALAFALFRVVESRQEGARARDAAAAAPRAMTKEEEELRASIDGKKARKAKLEGELAGAQEQLAKLKGGGAAGASGAAASKQAFKNPWSPMAKTLFRLRDHLDDIMEKDDPEYKDLLAQFVEIVRELSEEEGFRMDDFDNSPYGPPMLMLSVLEGADPPVDPATLQKAQDVIAKAQEEWKALQARKGEMSALERAVSSASIVFGATQGIRAGLTPEQVGWFANSRVWQDPGRVPVWEVGGPRDGASARMVEQWANDLGIDEASRVSLAPLADAYIRRYDEMLADFARREAAGETVPEAEKQIAKGVLAVEAQKRLKESVNLTPEQLSKLNALGHAWSPGDAK